jgi:hypothetical protein
MVHSGHLLMYFESCLFILNYNLNFNCERDDEDKTLYNKRFAATP